MSTSSISNGRLNQNPYPSSGAPSSRASILAIASGQRTSHTLAGQSGPARRGQVDPAVSRCRASAANLDPLQLNVRSCDNSTPPRWVLARAISTVRRFSELPLEDTVKVRDVVEFFNGHGAARLPQVSHIGTPNAASGSTSIENMAAMPRHRRMSRRGSSGNSSRRRGQRFHAAVHRQEMVQPRGMRDAHPDAQRTAGRRLRGRCQGIALHASRSNQRAREHPREELRPAVHGIRGGPDEDFIGAGGDVKYHRGYSSNVETDAGKPLHLSMSSNPSHLSGSSSGAGSGACQAASSR